MERLTFDGNFCDIAQCCNVPGGSFCEDGACSQKKVWTRLKAYEDTGLTPERCAEFARADAEGRYIVMRDAEQEGVACLRWLAEADKDGRVVVLPCKVGDVLWTFCTHPRGEVYSMTVTDVSTLNGRTMLNTSRCGVVAARDVGETVFLTREEAEKALAEMEDKNDD